MSIQYLLQVAIEESFEYHFELCQPLRDSLIFDRLVRAADDVTAPYQSVVEEIRTYMLHKMPPFIHRMQLQACQDMANILPTRDHYPVMSSYEGKDHPSFAYVLGLSMIRKGMRLNAEEVGALCRNRKAFLGGWNEFFNRHDLHETGGYDWLEYREIDMLHNQFLTPKEALKIPSILVDVRQDGRSDILGRSIAHMEHDAGLRIP